MENKDLILVETEVSDYFTMNSYDKEKYLRNLSEIIKMTSCESAFSFKSKGEAAIELSTILEKEQKSIGELTLSLIKENMQEYNKQGFDFWGYACFILDHLGCTADETGTWVFESALKSYIYQRGYDIVKRDENGK